jgi:hypothetical protein
MRCSKQTTYVRMIFEITDFQHNSLIHRHTMHTLKIDEISILVTWKSVIQFATLQD